MGAGPGGEDSRGEGWANGGGLVGLQLRKENRGGRFRCGRRHHHLQGALETTCWRSLSGSAPECSLVAIATFSELSVNNTHSPSARDLGPSKQSPWSTTALSSVKMFPLEQGKRRRREEANGGMEEIQKPFGLVHSS